MDPMVTGMGGRETLGRGEEVVAVLKQVIQQGRAVVADGVKTPSGLDVVARGANVTQNTLWPSHMNAMQKSSKS